MPISCILVDDEELALEELHFLLDSVPGVGVVGQGRNGVEAIRLVKELEPDLMFLDIQMPGLNGFSGGSPAGQGRGATPGHFCHGLRPVCGQGL